MNDILQIQNSIIDRIFVSDTLKALIFLIVAYSTLKSKVLIIKIKTKKVLQR